MKVIEQNWELLGMDVRSEIVSKSGHSCTLHQHIYITFTNLSLILKILQPREGRYVKVATDVADRVIKELYDNV